MISQRLNLLSPEAWRRIDQELALLLEINKSRQADHLKVLARRCPDDVPILQGLLEATDHGQRLDQRLLAALSHLAGQAAQEPGSRSGPWQRMRPIGRGGMAEGNLAERAFAIRERLPNDAVGAAGWRANACQIVLLAGGPCNNAQKGIGRRALDSARLERARQGLCRRAGPTADREWACSPHRFDA